ncbi:MAG: hypothetical protein RBU29_10325 [bacterium]|jgi:Tol biopolymer transport system component|nr:hypothetical protein [bacterium]
MNNGWTRKANFSSFAFITLAALIALIGAIYPLYRNAQRQALFNGPVTECPPQEAVYYAREVYDTTHYGGAAPSQAAEPLSQITRQNSEHEIKYVDGEDRDEVLQAMQEHAGESKESLEVSRLRYKSVYQDRQPYPRLQVVEPQAGSVYPANLCPPYVTWEDPNNSLWQINLVIDGDPKIYSYITSEKRWRFPASLWSHLTEECQGNPLSLHIKGVAQDHKGQRTGEIQGTPPVFFQISSDPADNFIVYRLVAPPFSSFKTPDIYIRDIRTDKAVKFLSSRREYCLNCHNFSSKTGNSGKLSFQVRSLVNVAHRLPTYLSIYDMDRQEGFKVRLPFEIQMTTFMNWAPDHNRLAYSANQKIAALKPIVYETQLAGMATSDIAIYDVEANETYLVPGASDPNFLEIYPQWTPDGKQLLFSRSPVGQHPAHILFDLYILDLEESETATARPIPGGSNPDKSSYFPHFSPDGRWFSFTQSDGGDLIRASSELYLLPGDLSGDAHRLECNDVHGADSWHSWSSNSKWLVFSSKRESGAFAYLYLTHIDEQGHASPAIALPIADQPLASYNIPEFLASMPSIPQDALFEAMRAETEPREVTLRVKGNSHGPQK